MLPQGRQASFQFARGSMVFLSSHCTIIGPHLPLSGNPVVFLVLQQEAWGCSQVATGTSGSLSSCLRDIRPFELCGSPQESS